MRLGMTGNRNQISDRALIQLNAFMDMNTITEALHGDCIGSDKMFHEVCTERMIKTIIHPPTDNTHRAFCKGDIMKSPAPYLQRNHNIVDAADTVIAFPPTKKEIMRSGTWSTIRYARKQNKPIVIIHSDGDVEKEN